MGIIKWFNGKKTIIAYLLMVVAAFIQDVIIDIFEYDVPIEHKIIKTLNWFGALLGGTGLVHKYIKYKQKKALQKNSD